MRGRAQNGFTLIELMVVASLAVIVLTASVGEYRDFVSNQRLEAWADTIATDLRTGQQFSVSRRQMVVAVFSSGQYTVSANSALVKRGVLPPDLTSTSQTITFSTLGTTATAGTITLRSLVTNRTRQISVASDTGRVRVD